jgi:hypothetical protein
MRRAPAVALAVAVALAAGGCAKLEHRTDRKTLDGAFSHAFKRYYAAAFRMTTGHPRGGIVIYAKVRCHALEPEPRGDRGWSWLCPIVWQRRDRPTRHPSTYRVQVDPQGCFAATSTDFPATLRERVLDHRPARNPLVYIRSCP